MSPSEWEEAQSTLSELSRLIAAGEPEANLTYLRNLARNGNPWPYIEYQWGRIISAEEYLADRAHFDSRAERFLILDAFQIDIIGSVFDPSIREIWIKGNTGCGKGAACGIATVAYYDVFHAQVVLTRDSAANCKTVVFGECLAWWKRMREPPIGRVGTESVHHNERHWIRILNPKADEGFAGVHGSAGGADGLMTFGGTVLFWGDEGTALPADKIAMMDTQAHKIVISGNPRTTGGPFRAAFPKGFEDVCRTFLGPKGYVRTITIDGDTIANVRLRRLEKPIAPAGGMEIRGRRFNHGDAIPLDLFREVCEIIPGQTCLDKHLVIKANPDANWVGCMAHGRFPKEDAQTQLFFHSPVEHAMRRHDRWRALMRVAEGELPYEGAPWWTARKRKSLVKRLLRCLPVTAAGLDVASSTLGGEDDSFGAFGGKRGCRGLHRCPDNTSIVKIVDWFLLTAQDVYGIDLTKLRYPIGVDVIGVGKGAGDLLKSKGCRVVEVIGSAASTHKEWLNNRTERYATCANRLTLAADVAAAKAGQMSERDLESRWLELVEERNLDWLLPRDDMLAEELFAHRKVFKDGDSFRYRLTPKDRTPETPKTEPTIKEIIGRSPDRADAVSNLWWAVTQSPQMDLRAWIDAGALR